MAAMRDQVDYSVYLVTDSTEAILGTRNLVKVVEDALIGGMCLLALPCVPYMSASFITHIPNHN